MLITLIAPHVVNVFSITRIIKERKRKEARKRYREREGEEPRENYGEEGLSRSICSGVGYTIYGFFGLHELHHLDPNDESNREDLEVYDALRSNYALFEDHPQLYLQTFNSLAIGDTFSLLMLVSPITSIYGILDRFKVDKIIKFSE